MKFGKITALAVAGILTFAACKYEEGPRMSLRSKRDRVANEWKITEFNLNDSAGNKVSMLSYVNPDHTVTNGQDSTIHFKFATILNFYRSGSYGVEICMVLNDGKGGSEKYHPNTELNFNSLAGRPYAEQQLCSLYYNRLIDSLPSPFKYIRPHGAWAFDKGHYKIEVKPDLGYVSENSSSKNTLDWTIVKLAEKEMKLKGLDEYNRKWNLTLKRINGEPYFY